jgi:hypothetical protein
MVFRSILFGLMVSWFVVGGIASAATDELMIRGTGSFFSGFVDRYVGMVLGSSSVIRFVDLCVTSAVFALVMMLSISVWPVVERVIGKILLFSSNSSRKARV